MKLKTTRMRITKVIDIKHPSSWTDKKLEAIVIKEERAMCSDGIVSDMKWVIVSKSIEKEH